MCLLCVNAAGDTVTKTDYYTTVEEQQIFSKAFPEMVALFQQVIKNKEKQKRRKKGLFLRCVHDDLFLNLVVISCFSVFIYCFLFTYKKNIESL